MNEPKTCEEWLDALNKFLAMDEWHVNQFYLDLLEGEACHIMEVHQHIFEKSSMFNSFLSLQNLFSSSGLVKISASWSSVPTLPMQMYPFLLMISYEMMVDIYLLYSWMLNRVVGELHGTLIVI
jgi:hypothetical protein